MNKKIAVIIVTYNRKELLKKSIDLALKQKCESADVLVIDNNSNDGTYEYIQGMLENKRIIYINTGENLGGAGGFSYGLKKAYELGYDYFLLMDDDCMLHDDTISEFLLADKKLNGNYGFLSSVALWKDQSICKMNIQRVSLTKRIESFDNDLSKIVIASFVSLFLKREIVEEVGLPIKEFFIWADDWEYTKRISKKYNCYLVGKSIVTHESINNLGSNIALDESDRLERYKYSYRNECYLCKHEGIIGFAYLVSKIILHTIRILFKSKDYKLKRMKILYTSTFKGLFFNPIIEKV